MGCSSAQRAAEDEKRRLEQLSAQQSRMAAFEAQKAADIKRREEERERERQEQERAAFEKARIAKEKLAADEAARQQAAKEQQLAAERERAEKTRKQGTQACERARAGAGPSAAWVRREREADGGRAIDPACPGPPAAPG